jgi:hypothetical protein
MLRTFSVDLADNMAKNRNRESATLNYSIKRYLGTGNSSGIGIIFFIMNHPKLIHKWVLVREIALARAKKTKISGENIEKFKKRSKRAERWFSEDESSTEGEFIDKNKIADGLRDIRKKVGDLQKSKEENDFWMRLCEWTENRYGPEVQEVLHSLLIDIHPSVCDGLDKHLISSEETDVIPNMSISDLKSLINSSYQWALDIDMSAPNSQHYFWYRGGEIGEPRIGVRDETPLDDYENYELPVDIAYQVHELYSDLSESCASDSVAEFLFYHPEHEDIIQRIQSLHNLSYAEVRGNPLDDNFNPLDMISFKKSLWGVQKMHPKSKGWVRGTFFQGAPLAEDIIDGRGSNWVYPSKPVIEEGGVE